MGELKINFGNATTSVVVAPGLLSVLGQHVGRHCPAKRVMLVTDEQVGKLYAAEALASLEGMGIQTSCIRVPVGDASKSVAMLVRLYDALAESRIARDGMILALGGGVVSDLAGFAAATWLRGIRFGICPTSLEACVDAAIGGKTGINISAGKNLVGAFHQPSLVAIDPGTLETLDIRDTRAGLAESIKHALLFSPDLLVWHESNVEGILAMDPQVMAHLIHENIRIKADVVAEDAHEQTGRRILLNFGHTIGHAIEKCLAFHLRHGECVALGMLAATRLSHTLGLASDSLVQRVAGVLTRFGLPTTLAERIDTDEIVACMKQDKKIRHGRLQFVLLDDVGSPVVRDDVPEELVRSAYETLLADPTAEGDRARS